MKENRPTHPKRKIWCDTVPTTPNIPHDPVKVIPTILGLPDWVHGDTETLADRIDARDKELPINVRAMLLAWKDLENRIVPNTLVEYTQSVKFRVMVNIDGLGKPLRRVTNNTSLQV
jgi:hypothetical protein